MAEETPNTEPRAGFLEKRLSVLEQAFRFDERLAALENSDRNMAAASKPWWRNSKTITILATLFAAIVPLVTAINGLLQNSRESERLKLEQQDKIRQVYLDRVLKSGITEDEAHRVFGLLRKLKNDPELAQWADEQFSNTERQIAELKEQKAASEEALTKVEGELTAEIQRTASLLGAERQGSEAKIAELKKESEKTREQLVQITARIGDDLTAMYLPIEGRVVDLMENPIPLAKVIVESVGIPISSGGTDVLGHFYMSALLVPGTRVTLKVTRATYSYHVFSMSVPASGGLLNLVLHMTPEKATQPVIPDQPITSKH